MTLKHTGSAALVLIMILLNDGRVCGQERPEGTPVVLSARAAKVTGALRIQGATNATATIHYWNKPGDTISWVWTVRQPGNYRVALNYSLDKAMTGGKISLVAGDQQIIAPAEPTGKWSDFRAFELGVVRADKAGDIPVTLQAAQLPQVPAAALPDVAWLSLTPTNAPATSKPVNQPLSK